MISVHGTISAGEAQATLAAIGRRHRGSAIPYGFIALLMIFGAGMLGGLAANLAGLDTNAGVLPGIIVGAVLNYLAGRRWTVWRFRKNITQRAMSLTFDTSVALSPEAIAYRSNAVRREAPCSAITELFLSKGYWIFLVQMEPWFVPRHFFADSASERGFIESALSYMGADARERSTGARKFLATQ